MTTTQQIQSEPAVFVEAELNYLRPQANKPVNYAITPPPGVPPRGGQADPRRVRIFDARTALTAPTLDRNGFEIRAHRSQLSDFSDDQAIANIYYPEAEAVIKELTGAVKVVIFDHTRRYALPAATRRVRDHLPAEEAEARLEKRHAIINFWRPTGYPVQTWPLALCDAKSIDPNDLVATDLVYQDKVGETYSFVHNPKHRWFYYPRLTPAEVLLLKIYDSRTDGTARLTAHTAFDDPTSPPDAPHRRSIELRTLVFWDS